MIMLRPLYVKSQANCGTGDCEGFTWDEEEEDEVNDEEDEDADADAGDDELRREEEVDEV